MKKITQIATSIFFLAVIYAFYIPSKLSYSAEFRANKIMNYYDTTLSSVMYQGMAFIYDKPYEHFSPANCINSGIVSLNNRPLYFEPTIQMYLDSADRRVNSGINWSLSESSELNSFTYSALSDYPVFNGVKNLPHVMSKSENLVISLDNLQGADEIEFNIDDLKLHLIAPWYRKVLANTTVLIIPKNHLKDLALGTVTLRISFIKNEVTTLKGQSFKFENRLHINKAVNLID